MKQKYLLVIAIVLFIIALTLELSEPGDGVTWAVVGVGLLLVAKTEWPGRRSSS